MQHSNILGLIKALHLPPAPAEAVSPAFNNTMRATFGVNFHQLQQIWILTGLRELGRLGCGRACCFKGGSMGQKFVFISIKNCA